MKHVSLLIAVLCLAAFSQSPARLTNPFSGDTVGPPIIWPAVYPVREPVFRLFSVPFDNAVATNDAGRYSRICLLKFGKAGLTIKSMASHRVREYALGDDLCYGPVLPDSSVFYTYGITVGRIDRGGRKVRDFMPDFSPGEIDNYFIVRYEVLDPQGPLLALDYSFPGSGGEPIHILTGIAFSRDTFSVRFRIGKDEQGCKGRGCGVWTAHDGRVFRYDAIGGNFIVYNADGAADSHPFADAFNACRDKPPGIILVLIHPTLPFAVIHAFDTASMEAVWVFSWRDRAEKAVRLITGAGDMYQTVVSSSVKGLAVELAGFSPDGGWLVIKDRSVDYDNPSFFVLPVDSSYSNFLGAPVLLGRRETNENWAYGHAWISSPRAFAVAGGGCIYKWDLE